MQIGHKCTNDKHQAPKPRPNNQKQKQEWQQKTIVIGKEVQPARTKEENGMEKANDPQATKSGGLADRQSDERHKVKGKSVAKGSQKGLQDTHMLSTANGFTLLNEAESDVENPSAAAGRGQCSYVVEAGPSQTLFIPV